MELDYENSGIKTLRTASTVLLIGFILAAVLQIPNCIVHIEYKSEIIWANVANVVILFVSGFFINGLGKSIAIIAEKALYDKQQIKLNEPKVEYTSTFKGDSRIKMNTIVVNLKTGKQMRIEDVSKDGLYKCYSNGVLVGYFSEGEIVEFNEWVEKYNKQ